MMNRRSFFGTIAGLFGAATVTVGRKEPVDEYNGIFSLPRYPYHKLTDEEINYLFANMKAGTIVRLPDSLANRWSIQEYR